MNSIPSFRNSNVKYVYLEKVDVTPDYREEKVKADAQNYLLRRSRTHHKPSVPDKVKAAIGALAGAAFPIVYMMKKQGVKNPLKVKYGLSEMVL